MLTIPQIILRAEISQYLVVNAAKKGGLFGGGIPNHLAELIYMVRKAVQRMYALDPTEENLIGNANYLYTLCGKFGLESGYRISTSGGSITPVVPGGSVFGYPLTSQYTATTDGETSFVLRDVDGNILPTGSIITWVSKSNNPLPLQSIQYNYVHPNLNLLGGIALSIDETLSFQYVVPI